MHQFVFRKPGFKKRQSEKLKDPNTRKSILIDVEIVNDSKSLMLFSEKDYTLFPLYIHILGKLDLETETWTIRQDEFKNWFRRTFQVNNRFDIVDRLETLSNLGLIEFKQVSNDVLSDSKQHSNEVQTAKELPLEQAEKPVAVISNNNQARKEKLSSSSPTPPIQNSPPVSAEDADDPLFKKLNITLVYEDTGIKKSEYQWLKEQLIHEVKRSGYRNIQLLGGLTMFISTNPVAQKLGHFWLSRAPAERMAALGFVIGNPKARNELAYAVDAIEKRYEAYLKNYSTCEKAVTENDFEVIV